MSKTRKLRKGGSRRRSLSVREPLSSVPFADPMHLPGPPSSRRFSFNRSNRSNRSNRPARVGDSQSSEVRATTNKEIIWPKDLIHDRDVYRFHSRAFPNSQNMEKGTRINIVGHPNGTTRIHPLTMIVTAEKGDFKPSNDGYYYALVDPRNNYLLIPVIKHPTKKKYMSYEKNGTGNFSPAADLLMVLAEALASGKKKTIKKRKKKQKKQKQQKK
tara:strand:+ start:9303 stop:9947 length:645 start_codon:yes stop_codon:yes gene_type:complete